MTLFLVVPIPAFGVRANPTGTVLVASPATPGVFLSVGVLEVSVLSDVGDENDEAEGFNPSPFFAPPPACVTLLLGADWFLAVVECDEDDDEDEEEEEGFAPSSFFA